MADFNMQTALAWLNRAADVMTKEKHRLTELDAAIGDSDHGENMARGFDAVKTKLDTPPADLTSLFKTVGMTLISTVGGASGPLYGTFFLEISKKVNRKSDIDTPSWADCLEAGINGIVMRGKAELNDKTMIDALSPALQALRDNITKPIAEAARLSAEAAEKGAEATIPLIAHKGRASYLGERSIGHQDPGATSSALILKALADSLQ